MLLMIIGTVILVWFIRWFKKREIDLKRLGRNSFITVTACVIGFLIASAGVIFPLHGYYEPVIVEECQLVEIIEDTDVYVIQKEGKVPFFGYVSYSGELDLASQVAFENTEVIISDKYETPTLVRYEAEPIRSILTFATIGTKIEYKIYAREENIRRLK